MKATKKIKVPKPRKPQSLLQQLAAKPEKLFSGAFVQQYAALCFRSLSAGGIEILVVTSRDSGRWIIPKGWPMKRRKPYEAALSRIKAPIGIFDKARDSHALALSVVADIAQARLRLD